tara:strand:+ start:60469 stop:61848 length:1380 start_codon:yes stop_codon:yes gene_type:complete
MFSRRTALQTTGCGFGYLAFSGLATQAAISEQSGPLAPKDSHFPAKAKRVIFLCMRGGPSHVDTFDYKPQLAKHDGKEPGSVGVGLNGQNGRRLKKSPWKFNRHGDSGIRISELFPHLSKHADDLCVLNGSHTDIPNHPQALVQLHTGNFQFVRPSVGAWVLYGLGTENQDLPGFITIKPPTRLGGAQNYGSAFLPAVYQGTAIGRSGNMANASVDNIKNLQLASDLQRKQIDLLQSMNRNAARRNPTNTELEGVIESYELGYRMQSAVPDVMNLTKESEATLKKYGIGGKGTDEFGRQCLMARRFAEAGVRYIELTHENWDQHSGLHARLTSNCQATDQPIAALMSDLKERDMLKDTLVIWSGEFGRTPAVRRDDGRDHNATGYTVWMAGGGVKGGMNYGSTDEFGIAATEGKMHVHDLHATVLHLLGIDHTKLTYRYAGRDFRLTDVYGRVADEIFA